MANKRYYWLKLQQDFFDQKEIKKLRKIAGGDTYVIIYLKMQLKSLKDGGVLQYTGIENSFVEELALDLDEEIDNVTVTLQYLASRNLIETSDDIHFLLPCAVENTGSESDSAKRMRDFRQKNRPQIESVYVDSSNAICDTVNSGKPNERHNVQKCDTDIDIDKEKDIDIEKKKKRFSPPTINEVQDYIREKGYHVNAESFIAFYESKGWKVGNQPMVSWKACVRTWEQRELKERKQTKPKGNTLSDSMTHGYDMDELRRRAKE